MGMKSRDGKDT